MAGRRSVRPLTIGASPMRQSMRRATTSARGPKAMRVGYAALVVACLMLGSAPARAECLLLAEFARQLGAKYHEQPIARAIQGGMPIIVFASPTGATYTIA